MNPVSLTDGLTLLAWLAMSVAFWWAWPHVLLFLIDPDQLKRRSLVCFGCS